MPGKDTGNCVFEERIFYANEFSMGNQWNALCCLFKNGLIKIILKVFINNVATLEGKVSSLNNKVDELDNKRMVFNIKVATLNDKVSRLDKKILALNAKKARLSDK